MEKLLLCCPFCKEDEAQQVGIFAGLRILQCKNCDGTFLWIRPLYKETLTFEKET